MGNEFDYDVMIHVEPARGVWSNPVISGIE
jgi:hypothetical protein